MAQRLSKSRIKRRRVQPGTITLGIVGSEAAKFTKRTEELARQAIQSLIREYRPIEIVSGGCHLGGVDIYAIEEAELKGIPTQEFLPEHRTWEGGYKQRNFQIANRSDLVVCITVRKLPKAYKVRGWEHYCYHCNTKDHIKSGGCWTVKEARRLGKQGRIIVIE